MIAITTPAAGAGSTVVTSAADAGPGTLRDAVAAAADGDRIEIAPGINPTLAGQEIAIDDKRLTIGGQGAGETVIDGALSSRIFAVYPGGELTLTGVTLTRGRAPTKANGGAIANAGIVTVQDSIMHENESGDEGDGGAIHNEGTMTLEHASLTDNVGHGANRPEEVCSWGDQPACPHKGSNGGAIMNAEGGELIIRHSTLSGNLAGLSGIDFREPGDGGGIFNSGALTISDSLLEHNHAGGVGRVVTASTNSGDGGALLNTGSGLVTITRTVFYSNRTMNGGPTDTFVGGGSGEGAAIVNRSGGEIEISQSIFDRNRVGTGGRANADHGGPGGDGGAIYNAGKITIVETSFARNGAGQGGTGASFQSGKTGGGGYGGAIFNSGTATLIGLSINENFAGTGGACSGSCQAGNGGNGGAIHSQAGTVSLIGSTLTDNRAGAAGAGASGGLGAGAAVNVEAGTVTFKSSILLRNEPAASTCRNAGSGSMVSQGYNVVFAASGCHPGGPATAELTDNDPSWLGEYGRHEGRILRVSSDGEGGGAPFSAPISSESPAVDRLPSTDPDCTGNDVRGGPRPQGSGCDTGAFELGHDRELAVTLAGTGSGTVTGPAGLECGSICAIALPFVHSTTLTATPAEGSVFTGFSGDCEGLSCTTLLDENVAVTATFDLAPVEEPPPGGDPGSPGGGSAGPGGGGPGGSDKGAGSGSPNRGGADRGSGPDRGQRPAAGIKTNLKLRRVGRRIGGSLNVVAGRGRLTRLQVKAPRSLALAGPRKLRRLISIRVGKRVLPARRVSRRGKVLIVRSPAAKRITLKIRPGVWRLKRAVRRSAKLRFNLGVTDSFGNRTPIAVRARPTAGKRPR